MALVSHTIPGIYNGISEQPYNLRLGNQCENQKNCYNSIVKGMYKRPGTNYIKTLDDSLSSPQEELRNSFYHSIIKDDVEQYILSYNNIDKFKVLNILNGEYYHVEIESDVEDYFEGLKSFENIRSTTINDLTILLNREKTIKLDEVVIDEETNVNVTEYVAEVNFVNLPVSHTIDIHGYNASPYGNINMLEIGVVIDGNSFVFYKEECINCSGRFLSFEQAIISLNNKINSDTKYVSKLINSNSGIEIKRVDGKQMHGLCSKIYFNPNYDYNSHPPRNPLILLSGNTYFQITQSGGDNIVEYIDGHKGYAYIKLGQINTTYTIKLLQGASGTPSEFFRYTTNDTSFKTTDIANGLRDEINTHSTKFSRITNNNVIQVYSDNGEDFVMDVYDSFGNSATVLIKDKVNSFNDLPRSFFNEEIIKIEGTSTGERESNYYVKFENGHWKETRVKGISHKFDYSTTPKKMFREQSIEYMTEKNPHGIYFNISNIRFDERLVGDENSNPYPSFTDNKINNIFFFKNRLGFLSDNNIVLSRSNDYFNFYSTTRTEVLDDDPIDVRSVSSNAGILLNTSSYSNRMLVFADNQQLVLTSGDKPMTPSNVNFKPVTKFEVDNLVKPINVGRNVYFVNEKQNSNSVREYYLNEDSLVNDARDITAHVPSLVEGTINYIIGNTTNDVLMMLSQSDRNKIYVYNYLWSGDEKQQSAWNVWEFDNEIMYAEIVRDIVYIISINDENELIFEKMCLNNENYNGLEFDVHLDKRIEVVAEFNRVTNKSKITIPYDITLGDNFTRVLKSNGTQLNIIEEDTLNNEVYFNGDIDGEEIIFGYNYNMSYEFSQFNVKSQGSNVANVEGRLQIRNLTLSYNDSCYFNVEVTPKGRNKKTKTFTGAQVGISLINNIKPLEGDFRSLINSRSNVKIEITNNTYLPSKFQTRSWEGFYTTRSRSI